MSETKQNTVDISQFCDPYKGRSLSVPFWKDGRLFATDGKLMVWIPEPTPRTNPTVKIPNVDRLMNETEAIQEFKSLEISPPNCMNCNGLGQAIEDCECVDCGHVHQVTNDCFECEVLIFQRRIAWYLAKKILSLPDVAFATIDDDSDRAVHFKFTGGFGQVMPLNSKGRPAK